MANKGQQENTPSSGKLVPAITSPKNPVKPRLPPRPPAPSKGYYGGFTAAAAPPPQKPVKLRMPESPGSYVVSTPKNQIHRVPPTENALPYEKLSGSRSKSSSGKLCCVFFSLSLCFFFFVVVVAAIAAAVFYIVVLRPETPTYTVDSVSIKSFNLTTIMSPSRPPPVSPKFDATFTAINPNGKIGIHYMKGGSLQVFNKSVGLFEGVLPEFFQPHNNITVLRTVLEEFPAKEMTTSVRDEMADAEQIGKVPLKVCLRAPVKFKVGPVKTWRMYVKVRCDVAVDKLTAESEIVSKNCQYGVHSWMF